MRLNVHVDCPAILLTSMSIPIHTVLMHTAHYKLWRCAIQIHVLLSSLLTVDVV